MCPTAAIHPCDGGSAARQAKIDLIKQDFLERDGVRYVKVRRCGRLGWESTIPQGGSYSEFVLRTTSAEELMRSAHGMASDMIKVMDAPVKIKVAVTNDDSSQTDGRTVRVATRFFDDATMDNGQKMDVFVGLAVHECCHVLYTDFDAMKGLQGITQNLQNIIEDERIERLCCESKPGLANFLAATKYHYFDRCAHMRETSSGTTMTPDDDLRDLINTILAYVRYPKALDDRLIERYADILLKVREILTPYPSSTAEAVETARKIAELIERHADNQEKASGQGEQSPEQQEQSEGASGEASPSQDGPSEAASSRVESVARSMGLGELSQGNGDSLEETSISDVIKNSKNAGSYIEGRCDKGVLPGSYIQKGTPDEDKYKDSLTRVRPYVAAIRRALTCSTLRYEDSLRGCRTGKLDTGKLAEAYQGVQNVHLRRCEVRADNIAVAILIDESGSMWGAGEQGARDTAVLLNEALSGIAGIDLFIYGHTASRNNTDLFVYRERGFNKRWALGGTDSRSGNHDSIAILETAARVRRFTKDRCLLFVISDGAPNETTDQVREAVLKVERDNFPVLAISIDPYYDPSTMYSNNITLSDLPELAKSLGKIVKKAVMENTRKKIHTF